jgi:hypothetical protein
MIVKAHTDQTRFGNMTRIFSFQKQIKPSTDKNFIASRCQIASGLYGPLGKAQKLGARGRH